MTKKRNDLSRSERKPMKGHSKTSPFHRFTHPRRDISVYFWSWDSYLLFMMLLFSTKSVSLEFSIEEYNYRRLKFGPYTH